MFVCFGGFALFLVCLRFCLCFALVLVPWLFVCWFCFACLCFLLLGSVCCCLVFVCGVYCPFDLLLLLMFSGLSFRLCFIACGFYFAFCAVGLVCGFVVCFPVWLVVVAFLLLFLRFLVGCCFVYYLFFNFALFDVWFRGCLDECLVVVCVSVLF